LKEPKKVIPLCREAYSYLAEENENAQIREHYGALNQIVLMIFSSVLTSDKNSETLGKEEKKA
jgi:hypothetical protein